MENKTIDTIQPPQKGCDKKHSGFKHLGMMLICCLVPLTAALALKQLGYSGVASYLILLLCPIMHIFMMKDMFKDQGAPHSNIQNKNSSGGNDG